MDSTFPWNVACLKEEISLKSHMLRAGIGKCFPRKCRNMNASSVTELKASKDVIHGCGTPSQTKSTHFGQ